MTSGNVEKAVLKDFAQIKTLNSLLRINVNDFYWDSDTYIETAIKEGRCHVVKKGDSVKGSLIVEKRDPDERYPFDSLAIGVLSVLPDDREKGFGTNLVEAAKSVAFQEKKRLYVESFYEYEKLDYYKKLGFIEDAPKVYNDRPYHVLFLDCEVIPEFPDMKRIDIGDRLQYLSFLEKMPVVPSDVTFENLFVYDSAERQINVSILYDNIIVITQRPESLSIYPPVGNHRLDETILGCFDWLRKEPENVGFVCVPYALTDLLASKTKEKLNIVKDRDAFDYLYNSNYHLFDGPDLRTQHQNLMHFLEKNPEYKDLTYDMVSAVSQFQSRWMNEYTEKMKTAKKPASGFLEKENRAIQKAVGHCKSLNLRIGAMYVERTMVAFSIAGIFRNVAYIHFEKAERERGAYQSLIHFFGKNALCDVDIVNKEQDLGIPGLRTSKERYQPSGFVEKCNITRSA